MATRRTINMKTGQEVSSNRLSLGTVRAQSLEPTAEPEQWERPKVVLKPRETPEPGAGFPTPKLWKAPLVGDSVWLICLRPDTVIRVGRVSHIKYTFKGGKPVAVDVRDAGYLKDANRSGRTCCGGSGETRVFVEQHEI